MKRKVRVALVGLGSVSQRGILPHLAQPDALERVELVACCDMVGDRARETARVFGWAEPYADYDELLARADVEAVLLATPIPLHYEQTMQALAAGRHVYVQKTMTTTLAEADAVLAAAERAGRVLVASPGQMLNPTNQRIKQLIAEGALGKVYWAFSTNAGGGHEHETFRAGDDVLSNVDPTWYYKPGGGPVYDMAVYSLHTLTGILGPARAVTAVSGIGRPERQWKDKTITVEMDDNTLMLLDFGEATFAVATGNRDEQRVDRLEDRLLRHRRRSRWAARLDRDHEPNRDPRRSRLLSPLVRVNPSRSLPFVVGRHTSIQEPHVYADIMHLVECIVEDKQPVPSGDHARHVVELIEKAYESSRTGQALELTTVF
jgi:predicted dehydrogenase